jgi:hypothetical protein
VFQANSSVLTGWKPFTRFVDDGRIRLSSNAANRVLRLLTVG